MKTQPDELASALRERLAVIADAESRKNIDAHMERLRAVSEKIHALVKALPPYIDPQLRHFLTRHSYDKALEMLERPGPPPF
jgi:enoyl-[acyl-carrier-protein] reductase (NADH)